MQIRKPTKTKKGSIIFSMPTLNREEQHLDIIYESIVSGYYLHKYLPTMHTTALYLSNKVPEETRDKLNKFAKHYH